MKREALHFLQKAWSRINRRDGFSLVEAVLASAVFGLLVTALVGAYLYGEEGIMLSGNQSRATLLAEAGIEAARNIRDAGYTNLVDGTYGLTTTGNQWNLSGSSDVNGLFTRQIAIATVDASRKSVTSTVTWQQNAQRTGSISLVSYLTNWFAPKKSGGMLVFGDKSGATLDLLRYQTLDSSNIWSAIGTAADVDAGSVNRVARRVQVYASATRNEKVMVSRHYDGTTQYIYAQVYNGTSWGSVQLLSSWAATTFLDVQNFDATYLNDGTLAVVFSDNTNIPKLRTWNGSVWSAQSSLTSLGAASEIPTYIVLRARPATNEMMAAFFTQASDTISQYYSGSAWSAITVHATAAANTTQRFIDFAWSQNTPTTGVLVYQNNGGDKFISHRAWVANGAGGGTWGTRVVGPNVGTAISRVNIADRPGANEFHACAEDTTASPKIYCNRVTFVGSVLTTTIGTNSPIANPTDNGLQLAYDFDFENAGATAIGVYSDTTAVPKVKKYTASTNTWDAAATSIATSPYALGVVKSARVIPAQTGDDAMVLIGDGSLGMYSVVWNGTSDSMYTTPSGLAFTQHSATGGPATTDYWYDFAWDQF